MYKLFITFLILLLQSCSTALTAKGSAIRIVDISDKDEYNCKFVSSMSAFDTLGANTGHESENALNELRNKASDLDANAVRILHMETTFQGTSVTAEVLRCDFPD